MSGAKSASGLSGSQNAGSFERQTEQNKGRKLTTNTKFLLEVYFNRVEEKLSLYSLAAAEIYGVKRFPLVDAFKLLIRGA